MVRDGKKSEVLIDLCALPTDRNKGFKSLTDHGVETPTLCSLNGLGDLVSKTRKSLLMGGPKLGILTYRATGDDYPGSERAVKLVFDKLPGGWKVELKKVEQLELVDGVAHFHDLGAETITHRDDSHLCQYTVWDYIAPGENLKDYLSRVDSVRAAKSHNGLQADLSQDESC